MDRRAGPGEAPAPARWYFQNQRFARFSGPEVKMGGWRSRRVAGWLSPWPALSMALCLAACLALPVGAQQPEPPTPPQPRGDPVARAELAQALDLLNAEKLDEAMP